MNTTHNFNYLSYLCETLILVRAVVKITFFIFLIGIGHLAMAQGASIEEKASLEKEFDAVAQKWHSISEVIDNYEGLAQYCSSAEFQKEVVTSLERIHHFDSLIMDKLKAPNFVHENAKEERKTLKSIEEFESEYRIPSFIGHLKDECDARHDVEKHRKLTVNEIGAESYSGQVYMVELELYKYVHHIDKRLDHIEKHLHKIHIDDVSGS